MKSIYEEALEKLEYSDEIGHIPPHVYCDIKYALKQAKKKDKLLKLYQKVYRDFDDLTLSEEIDIHNQIKELEK